MNDGAETDREEEEDLDELGDNELVVDAGGDTSEEEDEESEDEEGEEEED